MLSAKVWMPPSATNEAPLPVSPILKSLPLLTVVPWEMIVPPFKLITLLEPFVAVNCPTVTVPPVTSSVPDPNWPISRVPLVTLKVPPLILTKLFEAWDSALITKFVPTNTPPPLLITRLLLLPSVPTARSPVFVQADPAPVTVTMLLGEVV